MNGSESEIKRAAEMTRRSRELLHLIIHNTSIRIGSPLPDSPQRINQIEFLARTMAGFCQMASSFGMEKQEVFVRADAFKFITRWP